jgi:hypothetical protein
MSIRFFVEASGIVDIPIPYKALYESESCGICKKQAGEKRIFWYNSDSRWADTTCFEQIQPLESRLVARIHELFPDHLDKRQRNMAHLCAVRAVEELCEPYSLLEYYQKKGAEALANLFNSEGIKGAERFAAAATQSKV